MVENGGMSNMSESIEGAFVVAIEHLEKKQG